MMYSIPLHIAVVIPVYQLAISPAETCSFRQTLSVLGEHPIVLVAPQGLDMGTYTDMANSQGVSLLTEYFPPSYFDGIEGYNRLLLSESFYARFQSYDYILICQLDAFIFRDEILEWCNKGYDYIGAPLIGHHTDSVFSNNMRVGNGGLSLRKVSTFLRFFHSHRLVFPLRTLARHIQLKKKPYTRLFVWLFMACGWRNTPSQVALHWQYNEDDFWSGLLDGTPYALRKPSPEEAIFFAFERFPSALYKLTQQTLPFGCHAWEKYEYASFWSQFITI